MSSKIIKDLIKYLFLIKLKFMYAYLNRAMFSCNFMLIVILGQINFVNFFNINFSNTHFSIFISVKNLRIIRPKYLFMKKIDSS